MTGQHERWDGSGEKLVAAIRQDFGGPLRGGAPMCERPVHTAGITVGGTFQASDVASRYSRAAHFTGERIPVTVRFSNGAGTRVEHDRAQDVRGMATRFHLPDGQITDLIAMTLPIFFVKSPDTFLEFCEHSVPEPYTPLPWWKKVQLMLQLEKPPAPPPHGVTTSGTPGLYEFARRHPEARGAIAAVGGIVTPTSYVRASYHAVHAFTVHNAEHEERFVRFTWEPVAGVEPLKKVLQEATEVRPDRALQEELRRRLAAFPQQMTLRMQIAESGDDTADATKGWPDARKRVTMGLLTITHVLFDQERSEEIGYNPTNLVDGIGESDDPLFEARRKAYTASHAMRTRELLEGTDR